MLFLLQIILLVASYLTADDDDTPIKKIHIRPTSRSDFIQTQQNRSNHRGRKIENEPTIIKVLKKPSITSNHPKKYDSKVHILSGDNSIHYAKAKVNGSFRNSPIRAINARNSRKLRPTHKA